MPADVDFPSDLRSLESDYELIRELGQGGMAAVYLARQRRSGRLVAIKAIRSRYLDDPDAIRRFAREARTVAGLEHPNIVRTEAIEQIGDRAVAIIMEHANGGTVRDRLREFGSLGAEEAESILRDVANALGYAHRRGIVHRDVKPENIFLDPTRRRALLSDFGIARKIDSDAGITLLGAALGTPQYMSPEQIDGEHVDGRSDIYSLGVLGWELLTGRRPWAGESLYGVIYKQKHEALPRITSMRPRVPANLLFAIEGALIKDKEHRFQTVDEFLDQLTYNPPPVLSQTFPPGAVRADYEPTVVFRPSTVREAPDVNDETRAVVVPAAPVMAESVESESEPVMAAPDESDVMLPVVVADVAPAVPEPSFSPDEFTLPDFEPNATKSFEFTPPRVRVMQALGLLIPLGIAAGSLVVLLGGNSNETARSGRAASVMASAGSVVGDSTPTRAVAVPPRDTAAARHESTPSRTEGIVAGSSVGEPRQAVAPVKRSTRVSESAASTRPSSSTVATSPRTGGGGVSARVDSNRPAAVRQPNEASVPATSGARGDSGGRPSSAPEIVDPFKIPASARNESVVSGKAVPSPRCLIGSTADQQACLAAYVAVGDAPLNAAFESLVGEMRRVAGTGPGTSDPPTVQRIRVEQRAWMSIRDHECPRTPMANTGPFWAQAQSECFTDMAASRASELQDAVRRLKKK